MPQHSKKDRVKKYIFRKWDRENQPPHPLIKMLPPINCMGFF